MLWTEDFALLIGPRQTTESLVFVPGHAGQIYRLLGPYDDPTSITFNVQSDI